MISRVLIANRGEIALRILRACKALQLETVAIYTPADKNAIHVRLSDQAICIGANPAQHSYNNIDAILSCAEATAADAIHPGYGFLSENADFAAAVQQQGLTFIGPSPEIIRCMGNKITAIAAMRKLNIPTIPGSNGPIPDDSAKQQAMAAKIGYPLLIKAASGGGGRGMRIVNSAEELQQTITAIKQEAKNLFLDDSIYMEKYLTHPRHIEVQILADQNGHVLQLGSRDCSVQRRRQKIIEEAPASNLDQVALAALQQQCIQVCQKLGYVSAGTIEFLYQDQQFYFIEMNTRIQVEHPVTELITHTDIIQAQLQLHNNISLNCSQAQIKSQGFAIECRVNAENPETQQPSPGTITVLNWPGGPGVRVDSGIYPGYTVPHHYDSLIGKIICHADTRAAAIMKMRQALQETVILGIDTNIELLKKIFTHHGFTHANPDINFLEQQQLTTAAIAATTA